MPNDKGLSQGSTSDNLQPNLVTRSPTVDELLQLLSSSSSSKQSASPPPVPPKPKHRIGMSIESAKRSLGLIPGFKSSDSNKSIQSNEPRQDGDSTFGMDQTKKTTLRTMMNSTKLKIDAQQMNLPNSPADNVDSGMVASQQAPPRLKVPMGGCVVYDSNAMGISEPRAVNDLASDNFQRPLVITRNGSRKTQPIVTESPDEANNNMIRGHSENFTSTVKILEVPADVTASDIHGNRSNKTFTRIHQRQPEYYTSSRHVQYPDSQMIPTYRDDGVTNLENSDFDKADKLDVETANGDSIDDQPLRSSTPTSTQYQIDNNSSSGASTATNNNKSSQKTYLSHGTRDSASDNSEGDTLNISRETDELTNTSAHNRSGCELVGIEDISGSKESSPKKTEINDLNQTTPYTVQVFNETLLSANSSPLDRSQAINKSNKYAMSIQELESDNLRKIVNTLQNEIQSLGSKVAYLTSKVDDLEDQLDRQKNFATGNKSTSNVYAELCNDYSPSATLQKSAHSRSVSTINKLTPMKSSRHNTSYGQMSAYSRNSMAALNSQTQNTTSPITNNSSQTLQGRSMTPNARRMQAQQHISGGSIMNSSLKRLPVHASTNSIYAESNKSGSASISPTLPGLSNRQAISPSSYLNLAQKRDQNSHTSMLSLSSIGNSTLRNTSIAGSVANLSQFGTLSQLLNWPSLSNLGPSTHQVTFDEEEQVVRMVLYNNTITMHVPSWLQGEYVLDHIVDAPEVKMRLNWVHGYRGRDCRTNIYYLPTGECVYFVAAIIVLYNPGAKAQRHYLGHTESVKCLAIHPNKLIVASGQSAVPNRKDKRPIVRVWNTVSLVTIRVIEFNEDFDRSICCLAFSKHDTGATLAVVDESSEHTITLLDWQREKNWRLAEVNSGHEPVLAIDFHPIDKYSLVAIGKATVNFWDIRGFTMAKKAGLFDKYDKPKYVLCMTFNDLGETITGDSNGNVIIWPRGANKPRRIIRDAHPGGVFSVLAMRNGTYLTGGRDRRVIEWDEVFEQTGRQVELPEHCGGVRFITTARGSQVLIGTLRNAILMGSLDNDFNIVMQGHTEATTALAMHPNQPKYITGGFDDQIFFINAETHDVEWTKCLTMPVTAACFSPNGYLLILGSILGKWIALDAVTQEILFTACDGAGTINCVKFSSDGESFCMGSSDCHVYVYQTNGTHNTFRRVGTCVGHSAPIKEIDWSEDDAYFQSQSINFELLFWRAKNCRPVDDDRVVSDLRWTTHNCTIGFNALGIWSDSTVPALVNHCDKSNNGKYVVAVTDTGYINIYRWPTYHNQCQSQKYYGNVDKLNFIKFLCDDSRLIAVGAKSCVSTEWTIDH